MFFVLAHLSGMGGNEHWWRVVCLFFFFCQVWRWSRMNRNPSGWNRMAISRGAESRAIYSKDMQGWKPRQFAGIWFWTHSGLQTIAKPDSHPGFIAVLCPRCGSGLCWALWRNMRCRPRRHLALPPAVTSVTNKISRRILRKGLNSTCFSQAWPHFFPYVSICFHMFSMLPCLIGLLRISFETRNEADLSLQFSSGALCIRHWAEWFSSDSWWNVFCQAPAA